jgi:hypothetical protein
MIAALSSLEIPLGTTVSAVFAARFPRFVLVGSRKYLFADDVRAWFDDRRREAGHTARRPDALANCGISSFQIGVKRAR